MTQDEAIKWAVGYVWQEKPISDRGLECEWKLCRQLQYLLCRAYGRMERAFGGEVIRREIALIVESWIMAQGTGSGHVEAIEYCGPVKGQAVIFFRQYEIVPQGTQGKISQITPGSVSVHYGDRMAVEVKRELFSQHCA